MICFHKKFRYVNDILRFCGGDCLGTFAFYSDSTDSPLVIDAHFNLWNQCGWKNEVTFLDIGVMIHSQKTGCRLSIICPFKFNINDAISLNEPLRDVETLNVIFNESYSLNSDNTKWLKVMDGENAIFGIYLLELNEKDNFSVSNKYKENTLVELKIPELPDKATFDDVYVRFRIKLPQTSPILRSYERPFKFIRGAFQQSYIIDFRYNDKRSLSKNMLESIGGKWVKTQKVHFLLISKAAVDVECSGTVKKRMLEDGVWLKYLNVDDDAQNSHDSTNLVAYHACAKSIDSNGDIGAWEFFAKQNVESINKKSLVVFIGITILISAIAGILGNGAYDILLYIINNVLCLLRG